MDNQSVITFSSAEFKKILVTEDGFILINKPANYTSFDIIRAVKKIIKPNKIGHMGTLDPFASGLLPIAINNATKLFDYCQMTSKTYRCVALFGQKMDSGDVTGNVINTTNYIPDIHEITKLIPEFTGEIWQRPHKFSATKVNGTRAYELARNGQDIELMPKKRFINYIDIINMDSNRLELEVKCSSGTYIRSLIEDMAEHLGSYAYVSILERIKACNFSIEHTITLENFQNIVHNNGKLKLHPMEAALDDIPGILVDEITATAIRNGKVVSFDNKSNGLYKILFNTDLIALGEISENQFKIKRVIK